MATIDTPRAIRVKTSTGWADLAIAGAPGPQGIQGPAGGTGPQGAQGPAGPGVPVGGVNGQALVKKSSTDFDTQWAAAGADLVYDGDYTSGPTFKDGEIVVYNGIAYICTSPTTSPPSAWPGGPTPQPTPKPSYGTTLPVSPIDGQEAILVDSVTNPTYIWRFRFNAGSSSAYKWEFIGGAPIGVYIQAGGSTSSATYNYLDNNGPAFQVPRAGLYQTTITSQTDSGAALMSLGVASGSGVGTIVIEGSDDWCVFGGPTCSTRAAIGMTVATAGHWLTARYRSSTAGVSNFTRRQITVTPVRVS